MKCLGLYYLKGDIMIQMIIADMDGTLLQNDLTISKRNLEAIHYLRKKGIKFHIATGRPDQLMKEYISVLQMEDPIIMYNGSVIGHPFQDKRLFEKALSEEDIHFIISYCEERDITYMVYTKDKIISKPNYRVDFFEQRNHLLQPEQRSVFEDIRDIEVIKKLSVQKILVIDHDADRFDQTKEVFEQNKHFSIATSQSGFLDINPVGANKGYALELLADHYDIKLQNIVAFGDQENDISMLKTAGIGVAMGNASEFVKQFANEVTETNDNDGFAQWVEQNIK